MSNFAARLAQANVGDIQTSASKKLAASMAAAQKKESKWRGLSSLIKTGANILAPGVGGFITSALIDPIGRKFGAGADRGDIQLDENYQIFGGREAIGTARQGLTDNISDYKQKSIQDALVGFGTSTFGEGLASKFSDKLGDMNPFTKGGAWSGQAMDKGVGMSNILEGGNAFADLQGTGFSMPTYAKGGEVSSTNSLEKNYSSNSNPMRKSQESGEQFWNNLVSGRKRQSNFAPNLQKSISENLNKSIGSESVSNMLSRLPSQNLNISPLEQRGENIFSSPNFLDSIQKVPESGLNLPEGVSQMSRYAEGGTHNLEDVINSLMKNPSDARYLDDLEYTPEMLKNYASSKMPTYEQGGMVQKYEEGGQIARQTWRTNQVKNEETGQMESSRDRTTVYDTYDYDGINWNKTGTSNNQDPQRNIMTKAEMDNYRSEDRTQNVGSQYMEGTSEVGINEFLKTPATAALVDRARSGDEGAMENLIEMLRQQRPEMADKSNEELRLALGKTLTSVDLYGQGYQDVLGKTDQTLSGMNKEVQGARAGMASQAATSGIRTGTGGFKGESSLSEGLYNQVGQEYKNMQRGIKDEFEGSFGGLESSFLTDFG